MSLSIRPATVADVSLVTQFIYELAAYEKLSDECQATEDKVRTALFDDNPAAECLLAFWKEAPAGFAIFFSNFSTFLGRPGLYLEDLFVHPEFRKRGIGRGLLVSVARLANQRGCGRMEWSVLDWNAPAISFYESLGAKVMPDWRICRLTGTSLEKYGTG